MLHSLESPCRKKTTGNEMDKDLAEKTGEKRLWHIQKSLS